MILMKIAAFFVVVRYYFGPPIFSTFLLIPSKNIDGNILIILSYIPDIFGNNFLFSSLFLIDFIKWMVTFLKDRLELISKFPNE